MEHHTSPSNEQNFEEQRNPDGQNTVCLDGAREDQAVVCPVRWIYSITSSTKWQKLIRHLQSDAALPRDDLPRNESATPCTKPLLYHYGFPFTTKYAIQYAMRHHMTIDISGEGEEFDERTIFNFANLKERHLAEPELRQKLPICARNLMIARLSRKCGMELQLGRPFFSEWDGVVALWNNYDAEERSAKCHDYHEVVRILTSAMNEGDGPESKLQWWFDDGQDVVCNASFACPLCC